MRKQPRPWYKHHLYWQETLDIKRFAVVTAEDEVGVRLWSRAPTSSPPKTSRHSWCIILIPFYLLQGSRSTKAIILQFSPCFVGSSAISLTFLYQEKPRSRLDFTSHSQPWKITFSHYSVEKPWVKGSRCLYWSHSRLILKLLKLCFLWVSTLQHSTLTPSRIYHQKTPRVHHHNIYWLAWHEIRARRLARIF